MQGDHTRGDPRHVEIISREAGAGELKTISTLTAKETGRERLEEKRQDLHERGLRGKMRCMLDDDDSGGTLNADEVTKYSKKIAARAPFSAQDRVDAEK